VEVKHYYI